MHVGWRRFFCFKMFLDSWYNMHGLPRGCLTWCSDLQQGFSYSRCGSLQMPAFICANMLILAASWRFHIYPYPSIPHHLVFYLRPRVVWWFGQLAHPKCHIVCTESEKDTFSTTTPVSTPISDRHEVHDIRHNFGSLHATTYSLLRSMLGGINWGILCILAMFSMLCRVIYESMLQQCILKMRILLVTRLNTQKKCFRWHAAENGYDFSNATRRCQVAMSCELVELVQNRGSSFSTSYSPC